MAEIEKNGTGGTTVSVDELFRKLCAHYSRGCSFVVSYSVDYLIVIILCTCKYLTWFSFNSPPAVVRFTPVDYVTMTRSFLIRLIVMQSHN